MLLARDHEWWSCRDSRRRFCCPYLVLAKYRGADNYGEITIGAFRPLGCVAVATMNTTAWPCWCGGMVKSLAQLLTRLDPAIARPFTEGIFTDEINPPSK